MVRLTNQTKTDHLLEVDPNTVHHLGPNLPSRSPDDDDAPASIEISNADFEELKKRSTFRSLTETDQPGEIPDIQVEEDV